MRCLIAAAALSAVFCFNAWADDASQFVPGTTVNGLGIGGMTVEQAKAQIEGFYDSSYKLAIKKKNGTEEYINGADIGYKVTLPEGLSAILEEQNATGRVSGPAADNRHKMTMSVVFDEAALADKIGGLSCIAGSGIVETRDAHISDYEAGKEFTIVPEVEGNNLDVTKTSEAIRRAVEEGARELDLAAEGCYYQVGVRAGDPQLKALCDTMNRYRNMTITYQIGENTEVLDGGTICPWLTVAADGQVLADPQAVAAFVQTLADKYDTSGKERVFRTADGREVRCV